MQAGKHMSSFQLQAGLDGLQDPRCGWQRALTAAYLIADIPHSLAQQRPQHWLHAATVKQYKL